MATETKDVLDPYLGNEEEKKQAIAMVKQISDDLDAREKHTVVFNGMPYSRAYVYNQRRAINYAAPHIKGQDREVSYGLVHEKIVGFCSFFLKNIYKRRVKCFDEYGTIVAGMGDIYDLGIEHSYKLEQLVRKVSLIYWETFTQGDAFIFEEWQVKNIIDKIALKDGKEIAPEDMDYTFEFFDGLQWKDGDMVQERQAVSRIMDGRCVILGNPELNDLQEQPRITLEDVISRSDAEGFYGTMSRWSAVPQEKETIASMFTNEKMTLFDTERLGDPSKQVMRHFVMDKETNRYNLVLNGVVMLPTPTSFRHFYPRNNYPMSQVSSERLTGSAYSRSVPMKLKFNADYLDWMLKKLSEKFEQGVDPALLVKGKYTVTKDLFKGGQRTHGIGKDDYEKADPDNKGITAQEFGFASLMKEIIEEQSLNKTTSGGVSDDTATAVNAAQSNQIEKLGFILDGILGGFQQMAMRRAETIESKYTIKQSETIVDGKKIPVYQNFTVAMGGKDHSVVFDEEVGQPDYDEEGKKDELFEKSFADGKKGFNTAYHLANPKLIRQRKYTVDIELIPERKKDTYLQIIELQNEANFLLSTWGEQIDKDELSKEYINITGRPDTLFIPKDLLPPPEMAVEDPNAPKDAGFNQGGAIKTAVKNNASAR